MLDCDLGGGGALRGRNTGAEQIPVAVLRQSVSNRRDAEQIVLQEILVPEQIDEVCSNASEAPMTFFNRLSQSPKRLDASR